MTDDRKLEVVAQFTDDILAKLTDAFFEVLKKEGWGKRDLSQICGINESAIGHILAGRRKNLTAETVALLARAMKMRPSLTLTDTRPTESDQPSLSEFAGSTVSNFLPKDFLGQHQPKRAQSAAQAPTQESVQRLDKVSRCSLLATTWSALDEPEVADQRPETALAMAG